MSGTISEDIVEQDLVLARKYTDNELLKMIKTDKPYYVLEVQRRYLRAVTKWSLKYVQRFKIPIYDDEDIMSMVALNLPKMIHEIPFDSKYRVYTLLVNKLKYYFAGLYRYHFAQKRMASNFQYSIEDAELYEPEDKESVTSINNIYVEEAINKVDLSEFEKQIAKMIIIEGYKPKELADILNTSAKSISNAYGRIKTKFLEKYCEYTKEDFIANCK